MPHRHTCAEDSSVRHAYATRFSYGFLRMSDEEVSWESTSAVPEGGHAFPCGDDYDRSDGLSASYFIAEEVNFVLDL